MRQRKATHVSEDVYAKHIVLEKILAHLYHPGFVILGSALKEIIQKNSRYYPDNASKALSFKGVVYTIPGEVSPGVSNPIHKNLRGDLKEYIKRHEALTDEEAYVRNLVQSLLLLPVTVKMLEQILPVSLHYCLTPTMNPDPGTPTLSHEELESFKARHQSYFDLLVNRLTYNLLEVAEI